MREYDLVVLGASFYGIGLAQAFSGNSLILDSRGIPGGEYTDAFQMGHGYSAPCITEEGSRFRRAIESAEYPNNAFVPAWTPYVSDYICRKGLNVLLFTDVLKTEREAGGFKLTIFNVAGKSEIFARMLVDTRGAAGDEKSIHAIIYGRMDGVFSDRMRITYRDEQLSVVEIPMPMEMSFPQARRLLFSMWADRPETLKDFPIAAVANRFWIKAEWQERECGQKHWLVNACSYDNPFLAFDSGCRMGGMLNDPNA